MNQLNSYPMPTVAELELRRRDAQAYLDSQKDAVERNRAGQFATPPGLALDIARYARECWKNRGDAIHFLDPALGTGAFYSALRCCFPRTAIRTAAGVEIDPPFAATAATLWESSGFQVLQGDFTRLEPPEQGYNLVLTNPPYVRHHHLPLDEKERLRAAVARQLGIRVSGLAGLYCYFLLLAHGWLSEDGLAVWLIPSEFMDVNYGGSIRRYLTEHVTLLHIHRFCPSDVQFSDALVSSSVVVFKKRSPQPGQAALFTLGGTLLDPQARQEIPLSALRGARKWTNYPRDGHRHSPAPDLGTTLGDLFAIRRGIATGANDFFIIPREKALQWGIPSAYAKPILPSPRHLSLQIIECAPDRSPLVSPSLCLIDCDQPEENLRTLCPALWEYLQSGKRRHIDQGYLASRRTPWYSQEKREPPPFLCTYMGRAQNGRKPFRFLWNKSAAIASNLYLLLYPTGALRSLLAANPGLHGTVFDALSQIETEMFLREGRVYGGGLYKMEPKELARLPAEPLLKAIEELRAYGRWRRPRSRSVSR